MSSHHQNAQATPPATTPGEGAAETPAGRAHAPRIASAAGVSPLRLVRRNIGLLCAEPGRPEALAVHRAAVELGAHVALVLPRFDPEDTATLAGTGRLLDRLYDVVVCVGLAPELVQALRRHAGIPVLDESGIGLAERDAAGLPGEDGEDGEAPDRAVLHWQAALVDCLA